MDSDSRAYWDRVADAKTFTHPLNAGWLAEHLPRGARWLDYGCGYGRLCAELRGLGWESGVGLDASAAMIERARREQPWLDLRLDAAIEDEAELGRFDAVLLFSVWTCNPEDEDLEALMGRVRRLLRPGGLVYVSDLGLQVDERNQRRYRAAGSGPWGSFQLDQGPRLRHFDGAAVRRLLRGFRELRRARLRVATMNGNRAEAFQVLGRLEPTP